MTRSSSYLISVIAMVAAAIAVAPAAAQPVSSSGDYQAPNAVVSPQDPGSTSLNATLASSSSQPATPAGIDRGSGGTAPISGAHEPESTVVAVPSVAADTGNDSGGFDWTAALIVAGGALALLALALAAARTSARHRRATAASRA